MFVLKCSTCGETFHRKGTADFQSVGDGGPAECTGVEITDEEGPDCPKCGSEDTEVTDEYDDDDIS